MSYGPGIAVAAPAPRSKKQSSKCKEQKDNEQKCKCGSSDHKCTTHQDCPLNKKNNTSTTQDRLVPQMSQQVCQVAILMNQVHGKLSGTGIMCHIYLCTQGSRPLLARKDQY